ncbi:wolframin isoform X2 [Neoarius graeffei]|uniref:wolframin isoform X2 n=1 Tax=Neoarius graeffei TaxID=443677 RepID=UPI00298D5B7A|nr:wolframin isoform X2 [Neoarius graeffei]
MDVSCPASAKKSMNPDDSSLPPVTPLTPPTLPKDSSHSPVPTARSPHGQVRRGRGFAAVAKQVIQEKRRRKQEDQERVEEEEDAAEEDLSFEELLEKAKEGDPKAQSRLGKHYLKLGEDSEADVNNQIAVDWLVKAAKQGRSDAAKLLQQCWIKKKGITPQNEAQVRSLARESKFEQAVRRAAITMYWKLNPDRKEKMDKREILQNVTRVNSEAGVVSSGASDIQTQRKFLEKMVTNEPHSQYMDVEGFVEMTKKYTENITQTPQSEELSQDTARGGAWDWNDLTTLDKTQQKGGCPVSQKKSVWPGSQMMLETKHSIKKAIDIKSYFLGLQYPLHLILDVKEHLVDWASRAGVQWLSTIIPTQHVNTLIFFFIISNLSVDLFFFIIPLLTFYLAFISMAICTLRVFRSSKCWQKFSALAALLRRFEPELDVESHFGWSQLEQHLYFLVSVCFVIFSFPLADKRWIPCSELCTVAMFFTALSYASLTPAAASYTRRAFIIEVASSICALTTRLPEEFKMLRLLGQTFATVPVGDMVELMISLPCLLYVYLFYLFFSMARMHGFRGTYCFLVPYLVCFMWLEFAVVLLQNSTLIGLIRTCVAYFLLLFALPILALGLMVMLAIQIVKWFVELELTKLLVTLAVCVVPVILRLWTRFSLSILSVLRSITHRGPVKLILLCLCCVFLVCVGYVYSAEGLKVYNSTLTWKQYGTLCGPSAWKQHGITRTQILCSHLQGHRVTWSGKFQGVRVAETENGAQSLINLLPIFMGDWLLCLYGDEYPSCEGRNISSSLQEQTSVNVSVLFQQREEEELCRIKPVAKHHCHVKRFDKYRFEVTVRRPVDGAEIEDTDSDIILLASHEFKQVLLNLDDGSMVEFSTKLEGKLGSKQPRLELKAIHCLNCRSSLLPEGRQVKLERNWRKSVQAAIRFAFDFFFSPLLSARFKM